MKKLGVVFLVLVVGMVVWGKLGKVAGVDSKGWFMPIGRTLSPTPTLKPKTVYSALLLGGGGVGHQGGELTDTMVLVVVDTASKSAAMVNIPRDIYVETKDTEGKTAMNKINFGYFLGGADEAKRLAERVTGIKPDFYAWIDFGGFARTIDLLGGIEVEVPQSFVDELYPIAGKEEDPCGHSEEEIKQITATLSGLLVDRQFMCRYERLEFKKGKMTMDGQTALKFVRSRHSAVGGGDFARAMRQQAVLVAVRNKLISLGSVTKLGALASEAQRSIRTDVEPGLALKLMPELGEWKNYNIQQVIISTENVLKEGISADRQYILTPKNSEADWKEVNDYIRSQLTIKF